MISAVSYIFLDPHTLDQFAKFNMIFSVVFLAFLGTVYYIGWKKQRKNR